MIAADETNLDHHQGNCYNHLQNNNRISSNRIDILAVGDISESDGKILIESIAYGLVGILAAVFVLFWVFQDDILDWLDDGED